MPSLKQTDNKRPVPEIVRCSPVLMRLFAFLLLFPGLSLQAAVLVTDANTSIEATPYLEVWPQDRPVGLSELLASNPDQLFVPVKNTRIPAEPSGTWYRLTYQSKTDEFNRFMIMTFESRFIDTLTMYIPREDGGWQGFKNGLKVPLENRPIEDRMYAFWLPPQETPTTIYFLVKPLQGVSGSIDSIVHCYNCFHQTSRTYLSLISALIGATILLAIIATVIIRNLVSGFELTVLLLVLLLGVASILIYDAYLVNWFPGLEALWLLLTRNYPVFHGIVSLLFAHILFDMKKNMPVLHRINNLLIGLFVILFVVGVVLELKMESRFWYNLIFSLPTVQLLFIAVRAIHLRLSGSLLYSLAFFSLVSIRIFGLFTLSGQVEIDVNIRVVQYFGNLLVGLFLAFALINKLNTSLRERQSMEIESAVIAAQGRARLSFLANMSHEIRTPINGVLGMIQLLEITPLNNLQRHYVDVLKGAGNTLLTVINDILDLAKIDAGKLRTESLSLNIDQLIIDTIALFSQQINQKKLYIKYEMPADTPMFIRSDPSRIRQIFSNLISNAIKFTEQGGITVSACRGGSQDKEWVFKVKDTGIGISPEARKKPV